MNRDLMLPTTNIRIKETMIDPPSIGENKVARMVNKIKVVKSITRSLA